MKVYIVTSGEYSDYQIEKVFLDKAKAEEYSKKATTDHYGESYDVEEFDTDDNMDMSRMPYQVKFYNGEWDIRHEPYRTKNCDVNLFSYSPQKSEYIPNDIVTHSDEGIIYCHHYLLVDCKEEDILFRPEEFVMFLYAKSQEAALKIAHERLGAIKEISLSKKFKRDKWYTFPSYQEHEKEI